MAGGRPVESEIEAAGAVTDVRVVPLLRGVGRRGALVLVREATELRRRDRVISRREATIREVHHRVKNNLQTVASLLRLQARRLGEHPQAVAALEDSVRRIDSIALVHETLTEEFEGAVDMADVARRVVRMLEGSLGRDDVQIELHTASVRVDAAVATPLAVVLNELIQNAIEHGLGDGPGTVTIHLHGGDDRPVELQVRDDGAGSLRAGEGGTPEPHPPLSGAPEREGSPRREHMLSAVHSPGGGLGLRLVRGLVEEELGGQFTLTHPAGLGSIATAVIPPVERVG
jgi:two-component sensor histidine kinase